MQEKYFFCFYQHLIHKFMFSRTLSRNFGIDALAFQHRVYKKIRLEA